jgi:hypothetical protein
MWRNALQLLNARVVAYFFFEYVRYFELNIAGDTQFTTSGIRKKHVK